MTAILALLVLVAFFAWLYLSESDKLDRWEQQDRMSQAWLERWHREHDR